MVPARPATSTGTGAPDHSKLGLAVSQVMRSSGTGPAAPVLGSTTVETRVIATQSWFGRAKAISSRSSGNRPVQPSPSVNRRVGWNAVVVYCPAGRRPSRRATRLAAVGGFVGAIVGDAFGPTAGGRTR